MENKTFYYRRCFLNELDPEDMRVSAIMAKVYGGQYTNRYWYNGELTISGCGESIDFDFDLDSDGGYDEAMAKVGIMIDTLQGFLDGIKEARTDYLNNKSHE